VSQPTYVTAAPGDSTRLFVVERPGVIRVAVNGVMQDTDFLDIHTRVSQAGEGGLLSMAFDPNYQSNGLFYVYYATGTRPNNAIRIEEFHSSNSNTADSTGRVVLQIPHPNATNHYGGTIHFGPGNYLYIATGDGGTGGANAPDTKS